MPQKETITLKEIEHDVKIKTAPELSEASYRKWAIPGGILGVFMVVVLIFQPKIALLGMLVIALAMVVGGILEMSIRTRKRKDFCMDDYEVSIAALSHTEEEHYKQTRGGVRVRHSRQVNNYTLWFENQRKWRIPKNNYTWSQERKMSDFAIYQSAHRGDNFIVVIKKDSGNVVMAYNTSFFVYKA